MGRSRDECQSVLHPETLSQTNKNSLNIILNAVEAMGDFKTKNTMSSNMLEKTPEFVSFML